MPRSRRQRTPHRCLATVAMPHPPVTAAAAIPTPPPCTTVDSPPLRAPGVRQPSSSKTTAEDSSESGTLGVLGLDVRSRPVGQLNQTSPGALCSLGGATTSGNASTLMLQQLPRTTSETLRHLDILISSLLSTPARSKCPVGCENNRCPVGKDENASLASFSRPYLAQTFSFQPTFPRTTAVRRRMRSLRVWVRAAERR